MVDKSKVEKTQYGYYTSTRKYSEEELSNFYEKKYYQSNTATYSHQYSKEEIEYFLLEAKEIEFIVRKIKGISNCKGMKHIDLGCGEGFLMQGLLELGFESCGVDFSDYGIQQHNPHLIDKIIKGNIQETINNISKKFDLITLKNVLEHVLHPESIIKSLEKILEPDGIIMINVPNDFGALHKHLLEKNLVEEAFWVVPPEHLHYFTHKSLNNLMASCGFGCATQSTDFPIDFDLLSPVTSYHLDKNKGKISHFRRVNTENFIGKISIEALFSYHHALAIYGLGRSVINYYRFRGKAA